MKKSLLLLSSALLSSSLMFAAETTAEYDIDAGTNRKTGASVSTPVGDGNVINSIQFGETTFSFTGSSASTDYLPAYNDDYRVIILSVNTGNTNTITMKAPAGKVLKKVEMMSMPIMGGSSLDLTVSPAGTTASYAMSGGYGVFTIANTTGASSITLTVKGKTSKDMIGLAHVAITTDEAPAAPPKVETTAEYDIDAASNMKTGASVNTPVGEGNIINSLQFGGTTFAFSGNASSTTYLPAYNDDYHVIILTVNSNYSNTITISAPAGKLLTKVQMISMPISGGTSLDLTAAPDGTTATYAMSGGYGNFAIANANGAASITLAIKGKSATSMDMIGLAHVAITTVDGDNSGSEDKEVLYTLNPFEGTVMSMDKVNIAFTDATAVTLVSAKNIILKSTETGAVYGIATANPNKGNIELTFSSEVTAAGDYVLSIPAGAFKVTLDGKQYDSPAIEAKYHIEPSISEESVYKYMSYSIPAAKECGPPNAQFRGMAGMGIISIGLSDASMVINRNCKKPFTLSRNGVVISTLQCKNDSCLITMPVAALADSDNDGLLSQAATNELMMMFDYAGYSKGAYGAAFTESGTYVVTIPDGGILKGNEALSGTTVTYVYDATMVKTYKYYTVPESGSVVTNLSSIKLVFPDDRCLMYHGMPSQFILKNTTTGKKYECVDAPSNWVNTITFKYVAAAADPEPGVYELNIGENVFNLNDMYYDDSDPGNVQAINLTFIVEAPKAPTLAENYSLNSPSNDKGAGYNERYGLGVIVLNLNSADIALDRSCSGKVQMLYNDVLLKELDPANASEIVIADAETRAADPVKTVTFNFANSLADVKNYIKAGEYKLVIPNGLFTYNGTPMEGLTQTYTLDVTVGVSQLVSDSKVTVVSLDGKTLLEGAPADALDSLAPGFYIVNGRKVVLTK